MRSFLKLFLQLFSLLLTFSLFSSESTNITRQSFFTLTTIFEPGITIRSTPKWDIKEKPIKFHQQVVKLLNEIKKDYPLIIKDLTTRPTYINIYTIQQAITYPSMLPHTKGLYSGGEVFVGVGERSKSNDKYFTETFVHELSHGIDIVSFSNISSSVKDEAYNKSINLHRKVWEDCAKSSGRDAYLFANRYEFMAETMTIWFKKTIYYGRCGKGQSALKKYDPETYQFLKMAFDSKTSSETTGPTTTVPNLATKEIQCKSVNYTYAECAINNNGAVPKTVSLKKKISKSKCDLNISFGLTSTGIFVNKGCEGIFKVTF